MNLHQLVRSAVTAVAPDRTVYRLPSLGQTTGPDYQVLPVYGPCEAVTAQVQPVADKTLQWLVQSRQNSIWRDLYVAGLSAGLDRAEELGGDLYYFDGAEWQVDQVLEDWRARSKKPAQFGERRLNGFFRGGGLLDGSVGGERALWGKGETWNRGRDGF